MLVLERLRYMGGRFTTVDQDGYAITTGALHMAPHGGGGPLARAVRELGLPFDIVPRDLMASFFFRGQHVLWNRPWDVMRLFGAQGRLDLLKITDAAVAAVRDARAEAQPFSEWLATQTRDPTIHHFFESFIQFAVSVRSQQISFGEMRAIHQNVLRYGMPGIPVGGCASVVQALADFIIARGGRHSHRRGGRCGSWPTTGTIACMAWSSAIGSRAKCSRVAGARGGLRRRTGGHARACLNGAGQRVMGDVGNWTRPPD